ncbi:hypothetical protein T459_25492 [Capsicum annuum]|uniref:Uncharacterized protein n=1 Tax=Capsicum annuum TaxID=4072 RepID=A0A2G2YKX2_CAPAN|nr:hypothetical protein T459_25492 [Capsicum annuum]
MEISSDICNALWMLLLFVIMFLISAVLCLTREDWSHTSELPTSPQVNGTRVGKPTSIGSAAGPYNYSENYNPISHLSSELVSEENNINANSEKELGNEFFKLKKFNEAIDCYSRSIALSPTAVAYANRAMAYLKIKRQAENDCTEALNLDDRYIKAYSRRSTAWKELGKLKESIEDAEFALRLEPQNQEIKKQYGEVKALYEKEILKRVSGATGVFAQGAQISGKTIKSGPVIESVSSSSQKLAEVRTIPAKVVILNCWEVL